MISIWPRIWLKKNSKEPREDVKKDGAKWPQIKGFKSDKNEWLKMFSLLWLSASIQFILLRGHLSLRHFCYKTLWLLLMLLLLLLLFVGPISKVENTNRNRNIIEENQFPQFPFSKHLIHSDFLRWKTFWKLLINPAIYLFRRGCHKIFFHYCYILWRYFFLI